MRQTAALLAAYSKLGISAMPFLQNLQIHRGSAAGVTAGAWLLLLPFSAGWPVVGTREAK
jgi:hypothetical protein